jgi:hypothetical protein
MEWILFFPLSTRVITMEDDEREGGQGDMTMISFLIHHPIQIFHSLAHSF